MAATPGLKKENAPTVSSTQEAFQYPGEELAAMDLAENYYCWILHIFSPYFGARIIEAGAGIGTFSCKILLDARVRQLTALEPAENLFPVLCERLKHDSRAHPIQAYLDNFDTRQRADSLVAVNVMEHIQNDLAFLRSAHGALVSGGRLLLLVPALPGIYGTADEAFGHFRRYVKRDLVARLGEAGFRTELIRYMNFPGVFSWFIHGRIMRQRTIPPSNVRFYDRAIIPIIRRLENIIAPPLGQSLVAVSRKL